MKTFVQIIDVNTGVYQTGMIDEPVKKGLEIENAIGHFGISYLDVNWLSENEDKKYINRFGQVEGTSKIVTVILLK